MAFVQYAPPSDPGVIYSCSGTVVSPNLVLTAGHCAVDESTGIPNDPAGFAVGTGAVDLNDTTDLVASGVSEVIPYPQYNWITAASDAALLVLSHPIGAPAVTLPTNADQYLERAGTGAWVAGWGQTYYGSDPSSDLQWANTVVQRPSYCAHGAAHATFPYSPYTNLCTVDAPYNDTSICRGDSGGPLLAQDNTGDLVELGIASWDPNDCDTTLANYFTRLLPLTSWIESEAQSVTPSAPTSTPTTITPSAPPPPTPRLPKMNAADARRFVRKVLQGVLSRAFRHPVGYQTSCSRVSTTRFNYGINFSSGQADYYGNIIVYYQTATSTTVYWNDKYHLHWVNDHCYFHTKHPKTCATHPHSGAW